MTTTTEPGPAPLAIEQLTAAIGPSIGYYISKPPGGGYIVIVDGRMYCAKSTLPEAIEAMGKVSADRYGESATPPEDARDVTLQGSAIDETPPQHVEDDPSLDSAADVAGIVRPEPMRVPAPAGYGGISQRLRQTAGALSVALLLGAAAGWRG